MVKKWLKRFQSSKPVSCWNPFYWSNLAEIIFFLHKMANLKFSLFSSSFRWKKLVALCKLFWNMLIVGSRKCTTSNVRQSCYNVELNQMKTKSSIKCSVNITVQVECSSTETKWTKRLSRKRDSNPKLTDSSQSDVWERATTVTHVATLTRSNFIKRSCIPAKKESTASSMFKSTFENCDWERKKNSGIQFLTKMSGTSGATVAISLFRFSRPVWRRWRSRRQTTDDDDVGNRHGRLFQLGSEFFVFIDTKCWFSWLRFWLFWFYFLTDKSSSGRTGRQVNIFNI